MKPDTDNKFTATDMYGRVWVLTPPPKERWMPSKFEEFYVINAAGDVCVGYWQSHPYDISYRSFMGVYKTREEAKAMSEKIKNFVTSEIGEV